MAHNIEKIQLDILSHTLLAAMERFYSDPNNLKRFEEWLLGEEGQAYVSRHTSQTNATKGAANAVA